MSRHIFYCSDLSRGVAEKTYGTASRGDLWLLVEYPYAWSPKALQESSLAHVVKSYLQNFLQNNSRARLLFIKQGRLREGVRFFVVRSREENPSIARFELERYEQLLEINPLSPTGAKITDKPLYLVCTHGRRDKCCAKFGYPLYKSLKEQFGDSVWQSSHVGGDRFAANLVCFPHGLFYAHVTEDVAARIAAEYEMGRLVIENYRGRTCYTYPVQAAEYFIRKETGLSQIKTLHHQDCQRLEQRIWRVRFKTDDGKIYEAQISAFASSFRNFITCHSDQEQTVVQYRLDDLRVAKRDLAHPLYGENLL